jgi:hypothetical protein
MTEKVVDKIKLQFKVNGQVVPINGDVRYRRKGEQVTILFSCGTNKLDNIELEISPVDYIEPVNE